MSELVIKLVDPYHTTDASSFADCGGSLLIRRAWDGRRGYFTIILEANRAEEGRVMVRVSAKTLSELAIFMAKAAAKSRENEDEED